jgi:hypothetical protein
MDNFDLRKFLAESKQPIQEMEAPMEGDYSEGNYNEGDAMEELVAEYVTEALKGKDMKEVTEIIERTCNKAMYEMKMEVIAEVAEAYGGRINELEENAIFSEMLDETKMAAIKEIHGGLHELAVAVKEEYKKAHVPAEVKEEEAVEEKKAPKKEKEEKKEDKKEEEK